MKFDFLGRGLQKKDVFFTKQRFGKCFDTAPSVPLLVNKKLISVIS